MLVKCSCRVAPELRTLAGLHSRLRADEVAAGMKPKRHLLQRLDLPPEQWGDVAVSLSLNCCSCPLSWQCRLAGCLPSPVSLLFSLFYPPGWTQAIAGTSCFGEVWCGTIACFRSSVWKVNNSCPHACCVAPQEVDRRIKEQDASLGKCSACSLPYACPKCGRQQPASRTMRTAFQCQHALWNALVVQAQPQRQVQPQQAQPQQAQQQQPQPQQAQPRQQQPPQPQVAQPQAQARQRNQWQHLGTAQHRDTTKL